jgi:hypothetical protein
MTLRCGFFEFFQTLQWEVDSLTKEGLKATVRINGGCAFLEVCLNRYSVISLL